MCGGGDKILLDHKHKYIVNVGL